MDNSQNRYGIPQQSLMDQMNDVSEIPHLQKDDQTNYSDVFGESIANMDQIPRFGAQKNNNDRIQSPKSQRLDQEILNQQKDQQENEQKSNGNEANDKNKDNQENMDNSSKNNKSVTYDQQSCLRKNSNSQNNNNSKLNNSKQQNSSRKQSEIQNQEQQNNNSSSNNQNNNNENNNQQQTNNQAESYEVTFKPATYKSSDQIEKEKQERLKERNFMTGLYDLAEKLVKQEDQVREMQEILLEDQVEVENLKPIHSRIQENTEKVLNTRVFNDPQRIEKAFFDSLKVQIVQTMAKSCYKEQQTQSLSQKLQKQQEEIQNLNKTLGQFNVSKQKYVDNIARLEREINEIKKMSATSPQFDLNQIPEAKNETSKFDEKSQTYQQQNQQHFAQSGLGQKSTNPLSRKLMKETWMSEKEQYANFQLFGTPLDKKSKLKPIKTQQIQSLDLTKKTTLNILDPNGNIALNTHQSNSSNTHYKTKNFESNMFDVAKQNKEIFLNQWKINQQLDQSQSQLRYASQANRTSNKKISMNNMSTTNNNLLNNSRTSQSKKFVAQPVLMKNQIKEQQQKQLKHQQLLEQQEKIKQGLIKPKKHSIINNNNNQVQQQQDQNQNQIQIDQNQKIPSLQRTSQFGGNIEKENEQQKQQSQEKDDSQQKGVKFQDNDNSQQNNQNDKNSEEQVKQQQQTFQNNSRIYSNKSGINQGYSNIKQPALNKLQQQQLQQQLDKQQQAQKQMKKASLQQQRASLLAQQKQSNQ